MKTMNNRILSFSILNSSKLLYVPTEFIENVKKDPVVSNFHRQLITTRSLITSEINLIASPAADSCFKIDVIMEESFYENQQLHLLLKQHNLIELSPRRVENHTYKSCLIYTIMTRLSPMWNKASEYLIEGQEFLNDNGIMNSIKFDLNIAADKAYMNIQSSRIRVPKFIVEDFLAQSSLLKRSNSVDLFEDITIVHVLPSLKQGRVVQITRRIPDECPFKNYSDIRKHWHDMYGYQLPENDDNLFYCSIWFFGKQFTYPDICLKRCGIVFTAQQIGLDRVVNAFTKDFSDKCLKGILNPFSEKTNLLNFGRTGFNVRPCSELNSQQLATQNLEEVTLHNADNEQTTTNDNTNEITNRNDLVCDNRSVNADKFSNLREVTSTKSLVCNGVQKMWKEPLKNEEEDVITNNGNLRANSTKNFGNTEDIQKSIPSGLMRGVHFTDLIARPKNFTITTPIFKSFNNNNNKQMTCDQEMNIPKPKFGLATYKSTSVDEVIKNINFQNIFYPRSIKNEKDVLKPIVNKCSWYRTNEVKLQKSKKSCEKLTLGCVAEEDVHYSIGNNGGDELIIKTDPVTMCEQVAYNQNGIKKDHLIQQKKVKKTVRTTNPNREITEVEALMKNGNFNKINNASMIQFLRSKSISCRVKDRKDQLVQKIKEYLQNVENS